MTNIDEDFDWFKKHYEEFQKIYGDCFLSISNEQILGCYKTYADAVHETLKYKEIGSFCIQEVKKDSVAYEITVF